MVQSVKSVLCDKSWVQIPSICVKSGLGSGIPGLGKQRQADPWGFLTS